MTNDRTGSTAVDRATQETSDRPIVFFDGVCGLCSWSVDFVLTRDSSGIFRFAPLQGETASTLLGAKPSASLDSVVLVDHRGTHRRSTAVVHILWHLGGIWRVPAALLWLVPRPLRNWGYSLVASTRYQWFGKRETCRIVRPDEQTRFLP